MSRVRQELSIVQFQVENRQASASMDALRERAKKLNEDITAANASIKALGNVAPDDAGLKAFQKKLKELNSDLRDVTRAQNELMKGVKAADKLWKAAATGTVESLSVKEIKAGQRGIQTRMQNLQPSKENARELQAMRIAIEEGEIAMRKFEADAERLLKVISEGGAVSSSALSKTKNDLAGLLDVLPRGTEEYKRYDAQLQAIEKHISTLSQTEKRLAGEIVTVEDARKRAAAADADEARWREILAQQSKQQATADRERAEGALQIAKTNTAWIEQDIAKTKEQLAAQQQLVGSIEALEDAESKAMSKTMAAETALQKQREETNKFSDATWEAAKKVGELETKLKELEAQGSTPKSNPTLEKLKQDIESTTDKLGQLESQWQDKITDYIYEKYPTQATVSAKTKSPEGLKEREAMKNDPVLAKMREQSKQELDAVDQKLMQLIRQERELAEATKEETAATQSSTEVDKQKAELQQQLADAQQKLNEAKTAAEGPTKKLQEAEAAYTEAQKKEQEATEALAKAKGNMNLGEEEDKLDALERKHDDLTESLQKQKQAEQELAQNAADTRQKEQEAVIELAQAQNQSEESLKKSVEVLEQQNKTLKAGSDEWIENEQAIGKLNKRIEELKQQSQELRGEVMSLADAQALADKAMEEQALTTKTGWAASTEELKRAEQTLAEKVAKAKRGTAEEEAAYQKLVRQLQAVRTELGAGSMSGKQMMDVLSDPKNVTSVDTLKAAIGRARQELDALGRRLDQAKQSGQSGEVKKLQKTYDELAKSVQQTDIRMKELQNSSKGTASAFDKAWSRLKTYVGLYVGAAVAMQKLTAAMGDLLTLSDKMGEVRKTTGFTADEVGRLSNNLAKLDTRTSLTSLMELSSLAGSVGLKTQEQVQGFTEAADQLIVALPELGNESARTIIKIANATGDLEKNGGNVRETLEKVGSTIIALRANSASAAGPITDFVSRVGAVGAQAGISIDQIAALGSTIDALGGRVEMSATALSRMIPAIKNNSFAIANSIGVTEKYLKSLAPMEQMVLIFQKMRDNIQHINTTTEQGQEQMAQTIEGMLGRNATMREVMKDLEQQGARAGIVFGLLSQNVDELKKQLGLASEAYRENTALANEFNNMNETTAAKWERLKNQVEEAFVGDSAQRFLGGIIDGLRWIVDLLTGRLQPALNLVGIGIKSLIITIAVAKTGFGSAFSAMLDWVLNLRTNITKLTASLKAFYAANKANIVMAAIAAAIYALKALYDWYQRLDKAAHVLAEAEANLATTTREAGMLFSQFSRLNKKQDELTQSTKTLKQREADLKGELEGLRKKLGEGAENSDVFKKKQEELAEAHNKVAEEEGKATEATNDRLKLINEINSKYSTYLGYMLSEASTAETVASAHDLIIAALKEEMYWREQNNAFDTVTKQHSENLKSYRESSLAELNGMDAMRQQNIMSEWQAMLSEVTYDAKQGGYVIPGAEKAFQSIEDAMKVMKDRFNMVLSNEGGYYMVNPADKQSRLNDLWGETGAGGWGSWTRWADRGFKDWTRESLEVLKETATLQSMSGSAAQRAHETAIQKAVENTNALIQQAQERGGNVTNRQLAEAVVGIEKNISKYSEIAGRYTQFGADTSLKGIANVLLKDLPAETRTAVENEIQRVAARGTNPEPKPTTNTNPYGTYNRVTSPYQDWDADSLVSRRKEMLERVRALANGAEVQSVLDQDAKFISEATRKNIKNTKQAIEWYNAERLKIQDALHEKHLTNTGDWMDPKKGGKKASKMVQDEMKYYLDELDAYYTERKAKIQEAQNDEQISEAEARNRTLANEAEWQHRRGELQQLYSKKRKKVAQEEADAIYNIISERTGDTTDYIIKNIGNTIKFIEKVGVEKGESAMKRIYGDIELGMERSFLRQRNAIGKHMNDITAIINKENPYVGITEELRKNLGTMNALLTDIEKDEERTVEKEIERTIFILEQSTKGYALTWEELMREMAKRGWQAWANAIEGDTQTRERLMHQVYRVFEKVQDAIKKEASEMKKQADIMWSNILLPGGDGKTTIKDAFEQTIGALGIEEGRVSRANSLIGAGQASERVADRLAIQQMKVQLAMQQYQYSLVRKIGREKIESLRKEAREAEAIGDIEKVRQLRMQAQNAEMALNLATRKEQTEELKQQEAIIAKTEESEARLYKELREWADLLTSSLQSVFEASHAGDAEYYNELAKLNLTGKGGPGAGTYIVIDNEGTSDATAHYEYLDEREALERQHEIERENAQAEAWKKVMDDINIKMSETITDQLNAMLQNQALDANTQATIQNTQAMLGLTGAMGGDAAAGIDASLGSSFGFGTCGEGGCTAGSGGDINMPPAVSDADTESYERYAKWVETYNAGQESMGQKTKDTNTKIQQSTQSMFAKMTQAANLYGVAYQAMSNDNLSAEQKFAMIAVQAAGNAAMATLTANFSDNTGEVAGSLPAILAKCLKISPIWGTVLFAALSATLGGLMGLAASKVAKSKSEIAQATGANNSVASGRLATGMLTYAEGNVNEFTDPASLTPGKQYNVDAADGKTYRARYMGKNPRTHLTNGPEFHLSGERGREMIIDAGTTRQITMNESEIWHAIQTLSGGGRISAMRRRGMGVAAFAEGNVSDFSEYSENSDYSGVSGIDAELMAAFQASLNRNSDIMERIAADGIRGVFPVYGKGGLVDSYDSGKKTLTRHGQRY